MADAIKFQLNLGNGALNLAYNEIVYSAFNTPIRQTTIRDLDWNILIVTNPLAFTSFIMSREAWDEFAIYSYSRTVNKSEIFSFKVNANGSIAQMTLCILNNWENYSGLGEAIWLSLSTNSMCFLAR